MSNSNSNINWQKMDGLIPAIIQDYNSAEVLMLGYMNQESFNKTLETKKVTFFSRSKNRLWTKGETSGNYLEFIDYSIDCDNDALLIQAVPEGPTCHNGTPSCFPDSKKAPIQKLFSIINSRKENLPENSYTASLIKSGKQSICNKIAEESGEVIKAATQESKQRLIEESVDLIYHLLVLLADQDITLDEVSSEIIARHTSSES